jgi:hypothetical protein
VTVQDRRKKSESATLRKFIGRETPRILIFSARRPLICFVIIMV